MRFTHIDVKYEGHKNWSKVLFLHILKVFGYHKPCDVEININICEPYCVNLYLWTSFIVHVFDFLTFDIFLLYLDSRAI